MADLAEGAMTPLDVAHGAMEATPQSDAARLRFYERLADAEMYLLLEGEEAGDHITPQVFDLEGGRYVLLFDLEERLAGFVGSVAPYAALPGRAIVAMLAGQGIGLGVNLAAPSSILIPAEAVDWLAGTLAQGPVELEAVPDEVFAPGGLPEALLTALDVKLGLAVGLARCAYLVGVSYGARRTHLLAFIDAVPGAEAALARGCAEALTFSGVEAGEMDVAFFAAHDAVAATLARAGLRFDLPQHAVAVLRQVAAPGSDPARPPILR